MDFSLSDLAVSGTNLFLASFKGVFWSMNGAASWTVINSGLPEDASACCLAVNETDLFTGTEEGEVWRLPLSDLCLTANLSDPVLSEENWAKIRKDRPKAVFIPGQIKAILQRGLSTPQRTEDIPFSICKCLSLPARSAYGSVFMFNGDEHILTILPERYYMADDFYQATLFLKAKNKNLGYAVGGHSADSKNEEKPSLAAVHETEINVFIEIRQTDAAGTSRVVREIFVPAHLKEESTVYDPDKENWYSANAMLRPGKYTAAVAVSSWDLKKVGVDYIDIELPGPKSYGETLEITPPFFIESMEQMKEPEAATFLHKSAFTYSVNRIVPNIDNIFSPGERLWISYFVLGAASKMGQEKEIDIEAAYEVQQEDGTVAISWEARNYNSAGIDEVLPWKPTVMLWDEHGGKELRGDLGPGRYTLVITVEDKMSGATVEKKVPFEVKEKK
jgi:hypothetical protein